MSTRIDITLTGAARVDGVDRAAGDTVRVRPAQARFLHSQGVAPAPAADRPAPTRRRKTTTSRKHGGKRRSTDRST